MAGVLGKWIAFPAIIIMLVKKKSFKLDSLKDKGLMLLMGLILALHWSAFFYSIQISTVTIGLLSFSTFPVFVALLEPLSSKEKWKS